jgi:hypothetical protein
MALNQVVLPGFAAYRIGTATSKKEATAQSEESGEESTEDSSEDEASSEETDSPRG